MNATAVGYTQTGEWIEYTVEVEEDGEYVVESRVASGADGSQFTLYMDNQFIIPGADGTPGGFVDVPNTGDWSVFTTVSTKLNKLTKGVHVLKLEITGDWADIDYLEFKLINSDKTGLNNITDTKLVPEGEYQAFDAFGRFVKRVEVKNGQVTGLNKGVYFLKGANGCSFTILVGE